jgi:hypothetical protein
VRTPMVKTNNLLTNFERQKRGVPLWRLLFGQQEVLPPSLPLSLQGSAGYCMLAGHGCLYNVGYIRRPQPIHGCCHGITTEREKKLPTPVRSCPLARRGRQAAEDQVIPVLPFPSVSLPTLSPAHVTTAAQHVLPALKPEPFALRHVIRSLSRGPCTCTCSYTRYPANLSICLLSRARERLEKREVVGRTTPWG